MSLRISSKKSADPIIKPIENSIDTATDATVDQTVDTTTDATSNSIGDANNPIGEGVHHYLNTAKSSAGQGIVEIEEYGQDVELFGYLTGDEIQNLEASGCGCRALTKVGNVQIGQAISS